MKSIAKRANSRYRRKNRDVELEIQDAIDEFLDVMLRDNQEYEELVFNIRDSLVRYGMELADRDDYEFRDALEEALLDSIAINLERDLRKFIFGGWQENENRITAEYVDLARMIAEDIE